MKKASFDREGKCTVCMRIKTGIPFLFFLSPTILKNGIPTGRYRKALTDNYFSTVIAEHLDELKKLGKKPEEVRPRSGNRRDRPGLEIDKTGSDMETEKTGPGLKMEMRDRGKTGKPGKRVRKQYIFRLYLEDRDSFAKATNSWRKWINCWASPAESGSDLRPAAPVHPLCPDLSEAGQDRR